MVMAAAKYGRAGVLKSRVRRCATVGAPFEYQIDPRFLVEILQANRIPDWPVIPCILAEIPQTNRIPDLLSGQPNIGFVLRPTEYRIDPSLSLAYLEGFALGRPWHPTEPLKFVRL